MCFDNLAADRQAEAHAGRLGRHKWLKQAICQLWRDTRAGVGNDDFCHPLFRNRPGADRQLAPLDLLHRLDCVADQVQHDLLNLHMIDEYRRQRMIELERGAHATLSRSDES